MNLKPHHRELLQAIIAGGDAGLLAADLGIQLYPNISSARSRSAAASGNAWTLIRKKLVERKLVKRELYAYSATEAGKAAIK